MVSYKICLYAQTHDSYGELGTYLNACTAVSENQWCVVNVTMAVMLNKLIRKNTG